MVEDKEQETCCPGCQAAAQFVNEHQLAAYYHYRTAPNLKVELNNQFEDFDKPYPDAGIQEAQLLVEGIQCAACCWLIEKVLKLNPNVTRVNVGLEAQKIQLQWDAASDKLSTLVSQITKLGYRVSPYQSDRQIDQLEKAKQQALLRFGWSALGMMQVMMFALGVYIGEFQDMSSQLAYFMGLASLTITLPILTICGQPFFQGAKRSMLTGQISMDVPISLALLAALGASVYNLAVGSAIVYFDTICMFLFFLLFNRFYEISAKLKAIFPIAHIKKSLVRVVTLENGTGIALDMVKVNDRIIVKAGSLIPLDGCIVEGESTVSTSFLTGEIAPQLRRVGESVLAGSMNHDQPLILHVEKEASQSTLHVILELIESAEGTKPKMVEWGNKIAQHFLVFILVLAIFSASIWGRFDIFLAILVVSCPCALSLALPLAMSVAKNTLFKKGLILKSIDSLDRLLNINTIVFDKTGTLTEGLFSVNHFEVLGKSSVDVKSIVKSLEKYSEHPVGQALFRFCQDAREFAVTDLRITPHKGVEGQVNGMHYTISRLHEDGVHRVVLEDESGILAKFSMSDKLRNDLAPEIEYYKKNNIHIKMLSGDKSDTVRTIADSLAIEDATGNLSPLDKLQIVKKLQAENQIVCMVGDGLNDGPVLKQADLSFAMNAGVDISQISADGIVLSDDLKTIRYGFQAAKYTRSIMTQNLAWSLLYNVIMLPLAAMGYLTPYWAAIGMSISSILVVWNSLRLNKLIEKL